MIHSNLFLVVLALAGWAQLVSSAEQEIFLPPDCDALTINGQGFQLRFEEIKRDWAQVKDESERVEVPRPAPADDEAANANSGDEQEQVVVNENLYDKAKGEEGPKDYGFVDNDLLEWIGARATSLMNKIERYNDEVRAVKGAQRIVIDIMLLNILVDLDNLNREEIAKFKWVKNKLRKLLTEYVHEQANAGEVMEYTRNLIDANKLIELKTKGSNDPGKVWITNTQALRRILHEQRYSEALSKIIIEYLSGPFNMMKRSAVYQINRRPKTLDDGLYYLFARGRVPASFPFAAQDAISHGDH